MNTENEAWRVIVTWLLPASISFTIIKIATQMLVKDVTWTGAILTFIISILFGIIPGAIIYFIVHDGGDHENVTAIWSSLITTSIITMLAERLSSWFVYGFEIDKAMNAIASLFFDKLKRILK